MTPYDLSMYYYLSTLLLWSSVPFDKITSHYNIFGMSVYRTFRRRELILDRSAIMNTLDNVFRKINDFIQYPIYRMMTSGTTKYAEMWYDTDLFNIKTMASKVYPLPHAPKVIVDNFHESIVSKSTN